MDLVNAHQVFRARSVLVNVMRVSTDLIVRMIVSARMELIAMKEMELVSAQLDFRAHFVKENAERDIMERIARRSVYATMEIVAVRKLENASASVLQANTANNRARRDRLERTALRSANVRRKRIVTRSVGVVSVQKDSRANFAIRKFVHSIVSDRSVKRNVPAIQTIRSCVTQPLVPVVVSLDILVQAAIHHVQSHITVKTARRNVNAT